MEVMIPTSPVEFNFDSSNTSPYISAPSSPQQFGAGFFFSAPTSPTKSSAFYKEFTRFRATDQHVSAVPFNWEVTPGIPKSVDNFTPDEDDDVVENSREFAFDFSGHLETCSLTADELFDGGKIKPLKPPPRLQLLYEGKLAADSLISPKSPRSPKKLIKDVLSPRQHKSNDFDPFAAAHEQTCREESSLQGRGRENTASNSRRKKKTRSLSPFRVSDLLMDSKDQINNQEEENSKRNDDSTLFPNSATSSFASFWYRNKWKLKDLLLFRSASEGRATSEDQMKKYGMLKNRRQEDVKNSSFRSMDSVGSSNSRRRASAHELHYTTNRAVSEEMKKRTFLPYKRSLLGCLGLSSGMPIHHISKGFGSLSRS